MRDELLDYYNRELSFIRQMGARFAREYPKVAGRLLLEDNKCNDPHVERVLEGFAFLAARTRLRIDDDLPEFTEGLLDVLAPQHVRPLPSLSLVEISLDPGQPPATSGTSVPRGTRLFSRARQEVRFRTAYDTVLWPITVADATWGSPLRLTPAVRSGSAVAALNVRLRCQEGVTFDQLAIPGLRFFLNAEPEIAATLYELLLSRCGRLIVRDPENPDQTQALSPDRIRPVGFAEDEGLVPFDNRALLAHRLVLEYFAFPSKYLFLELEGLEVLRGCGTQAELIFLIEPFERSERETLLETGVGARTFRLGCTPVTNLFERRAEPIAFRHERPEYLVVPDARRRDAIRVYSVEGVKGINTRTAQDEPFERLYSMRHGQTRDHVFWFARRRSLGWRGDQGTDVYLSFVDRSGRLTASEWNAVQVDVTCHNGDIPSRMPIGQPGGDFEAEGGASLGEITMLTRATPVLEPSLGQSTLWRLISQVSLNYMSLMHGGGEALRELLHLHNRPDLGPGQKQIEGIRGISSRISHARLPSDHGLAFARGHLVELTLDEANFAGGGAYLFAAVLERFLGLYVSINSFCALEARSVQRQEPLAKWPPRSGTKVLL